MGFRGVLWWYLFIATWNCFHTKCRFMRPKARPTSINAMNFARVSGNKSKTTDVSWTFFSFFSSVTRHIFTWVGMLICKTCGLGPQHSLMSRCKLPRESRIATSTRGGILLNGKMTGQERLILLQSSRILVCCWAELKTVSQRPSWCQTKLVATLNDSPGNEKKILISLEYTSF